MCQAVECNTQKDHFHRGSRTFYGFVMLNPRFIILNRMTFSTWRGSLLFITLLRICQLVTIGHLSTDVTIYRAIDSFGHNRFPLVDKWRLTICMPLEHGHSSGLDKSLMLIWRHPPLTSAQISHLRCALLMHLNME